jgi:hypothetical protein
MLFMYLKHVITAGMLSAALALSPGAAFAQTSGSSSGTSPSSGSQSSGSQGTSSQGSSTQGSTSSSTTSSSSSNQQPSGSGGTDQEAVRRSLTGAREALAELTKLPAATQLQGESRQRIATFISDFNAFATATTDWRSKYDAVDRELDQLIGADSGSAAAGSTSAAPSSSSTTGSTTGSPSTPGSSSTPADPNASASSSASGAVGTGGSAGAGSLDPTIVAKLKEVRTHLDQFEVASGDPTFVVEKIEKILDQADGGSTASGAVGTSGSSASGSITLSSEQVQELRRHLESIKAAAKR